MKERLILITILVIGAGGCSESVDPNEPTGFIQVKGSDTIVNAAQMVSEEFMKEYPHVFVAITGGGSGVGIASLINRTCDVATASREMKPKEIELAVKHGVNPKEFTVAYDGVALIVNKANPIDKLTIEQLHKIFTGEATNWKEFEGGKDLGIVTLSREVSSGTHMYFKEEVVQLGKKGSTEEFSDTTLLLTSSQAIVEEVAANEASIGYLGMGYVSERTKALLISKNGIACPPNVENVKQKKYPLSRGLYFYTNGEPTGATKLFIDFAFSPKGQQQFSETGFVPVGESAIVEKNQ